MTPQPRTRYRGPRRLGWLGLSVAMLLSPPLAAAELVLFNWEEYLDPAIIEDFHRETGIRIRQQYFDTDESKNSTLVATNGGQGLDLLIGSGYSLRFMVQSGWLAPVPASGLDNLGHVSKRWRDAYPALQQHAVPYFWGTLGIIYRSDLLPRPTSWMDFFRPRGELHGKLLLIDDSKDAIGMALKALGYRSTSDRADELKAAGNLLHSLRPKLLDIGYFNIGNDSAFKQGTLWMAMAYNGDVMSLRKHVPDLAYVIPSEGGNLWVDYIAVLTASDSKPEAFRFIDFINRPEIAARNARYTGYATANTGAEQHLGRSFLEDPIRYPPADVLERSESYDAMTIQGARSRNRIWSELGP